jgi:hypothetical protein
MDVITMPQFEGLWHRLHGIRNIGAFSNKLAALAAVRIQANLSL